MSLYDFRFTAIIQALENDTYLAEALFFPEVTRYGNDPKHLLDAVRANAARIAEGTPLLNLHMRLPAGEPLIENVSVLLEPPSKSIAWRQPASLNFQAICWTHGDDAALGYIPALGIEVPAKNLVELAKLMPEHIKAYLLRTNAAVSLQRLTWLQRTRMLILDEASFTAFLRSPRQASVEAGREPEKPVLNEVATDLIHNESEPAFEVDDVVALIADALVGRNPKSVLLVGPSGVGKTAAVHEIVRRRRTLRLGPTPFWATSGSRLVAGMTGFGMWQERCGRLWREAKKSGAILHLGNLVELMQVGKSTAGRQSMAGFFRPHLARGDFIAIVECTSEQLPLIEREDPHLLSVFHQIRVDEPSREKGKKILASFAAANGSGVESDALVTLDLLHRRYATYSAYPGRPLRFLKNLLQDREAEKKLSAEQVIEAFSRETGLPMVMLSDAMRLDLSAARAWFLERVIGQPQVVDLIVDLLAIIKAGLTRPRKPISSLLFIGPTGVGKTEMAKSLAEFLFRDRSRMARFDMSEYSDPAAVSRLAGGVFGAAGLLTARVREEPFSVILFDEFEKAHPLFFDLLLQVLGEGRLTDAAGRVADFSNAIVIMTSNLGAESFQRRSVGFSNDPDRAQKAREHFTRELRQFVRPELFNRVDRIVPFAPLDEQTVIEMARRDLAALSLRDGLRFRQVRLTLGDDVAVHLARKGYDPRYGARPLKRAIERELLTPLGEGLNNHAGDLALDAEVRVDRRKLIVNVRPRLAASGTPVSATATDEDCLDLATRCRTLRCDLQRLERSHASVEMENNIFDLERLEKTLSKRRWKRAEDIERLERLPRLKKIAERLRATTEAVAALEDRILLALYGKAEFAKTLLTGELGALAINWRDMLLSVYSAKLAKPDYITLAVFSENAEFLFELARAYYRVAVEGGANVSLAAFAVKEDFSNAKAKAGKAGRPLESPLLGRSVIRLKVEGEREFLARAHTSVVGIAVGIVGQFVFPLYGPERGLHTFVENQKQHKCLVDGSAEPLDKYLPPREIERRASIANQERRRLYNYDQLVIDDAGLKAKLYFQGREFKLAISMACEDQLMRNARAILEA